MFFTKHKVKRKPRNVLYLAFQGAFSTILGVSVLSTVDAYIILTFFKTCFLVISFGMIHGLVFLPVALSELLPEQKNKGKLVLKTNIIEPQAPVILTKKVLKANC